MDDYEVTFIDAGNCDIFTRIIRIETFHEATSEAWREFFKFDLPYKDVITVSCRKMVSE